MENKKYNSKTAKLEYERHQRINNIIMTTFKVISILIFLYLFFFVYKPVDRINLRKTQLSFSHLEHEAAELYRKQPELYTIDKKSSEDKLCKALADTLAKKDINCSDSHSSYQYNFTIKNINVDVYGLEKPPVDKDGVSYKEFYIDINGENKGDNIVGIDKFPLRIYYGDISGGRLLPVNCNIQDYQKYGIDFSPLCSSDSEGGVDYLDTKKPFSFDVVKVGGNKGKTEVILHNVSFLRADCAATSGDIIAYDYCEEKQISWLSQCYNDLPCSIEFSK